MIRVGEGHANDRTESRGGAQAQRNAGVSQWFSWFSLHLIPTLARKLRKSALFARHPDLMRLTGVHTTVMSVVQIYLNHSASLQKNDGVVHVNISHMRMSLSKVRQAMTRKD